MKHFLFILVAVSLLAGCSTDSETQTKASKTAGESNTASESNNSLTVNGEEVNISEAMKQVEEALQENGISNGEVLNFRELQKRLPEELGGWERTEKEGQTTGMLGMKISTANATYETTDGKKVDVTLADTGGFGMAIAGMAAWSNIDVDKETKEEIERTATFKGHKSYEKESKVNNSAQISLIINQRFILTADCADCTLEDLKSVVGDMELDNLPQGKEES